MKTFYINLDTAKQRRNKFLHTDFQRWRATTKDEVPDYINTRMISMYNFGKESHLARCACFLSHTKLLEFIVNEKLNDVLILEDDAIQVNDIPKNYPKDSITYIGGFIYNRLMMDESKPNINHKIGINLCPSEYRILGCLAYIIPTYKVAEYILNLIHSQNRYKAIDIMLGNIGIKQYYSYPGSFREEGCESQISVKNKNNKIMTEDFVFISMNKYKRCQHIMGGAAEQKKRKDN